MRPRFGLSSLDRVRAPACAVALGCLMAAGWGMTEPGSWAQDIAPGARTALPPLPMPRPRPRFRAGAGDAETEALRAEIARDTTFQAALRADLDAARTDPARLTQMLVEVTARMRKVEQQMLDVEARLVDLDRTRSDLTRALQDRRDVLAQVLAALARMGRNPPPALLMRPDDALDSVRSAILLGAVLPELRMEAETAAADLAELSEARTQTSAAHDSLKQLRGALEADRIRLAALVEERQNQVQAAAPRPPQDQAQAEMVAKSAANVHDLVTRLETATPLAPQTARPPGAAQDADGGSEAVKTSALANPARLSPTRPFVDAKGLLSLPVAGVQIGDFGAADGAGETRKGLTIATRAAAQVATPAEGWVVYAGPFQGYGQLLILNVGGGYHIVLAGMERITVAPGQFVLTGEPVGTMGSGSRAGGTASPKPQLYVEFRKDGIAIDSAPWWAATENQRVRG